MEIFCLKYGDFFQSASGCLDSVQALYWALSGGGGGRSQTLLRTPLISLVTFSNKL